MKLSIALVQCSLVWEDADANRENFTKILTNLSVQTDLVALPEMFTSGFTMQPSTINAKEGKKSLQWMRDMALQNNTALVGSIPFFEKGNYHNRLFFVYPNGQYKYYDKRHTFTLSGEGRQYKRGNKLLILPYKGFKICPLICYDLRFPVWSRNVASYDLLLYVANWPEPRINAWDTLLKARAIENMAFCAGVNRVGNDAAGNMYPGHSAVYDALGSQVAFSTKEEVVYAELNLEHVTKLRNELRFLEDRDAFILEG